MAAYGQVRTLVSLLVGGDPKDRKCARTLRDDAVVCLVWHSLGSKKDNETRYLTYAYRTLWRRNLDE